MTPNPAPSLPDVPSPKPRPTRSERLAAKLAKWERRDATVGTQEARVLPGRRVLPKPEDGPLIDEWVALHELERQDAEDLLFDQRPGQFGYWNAASQRLARMTLYRLSIGCPTPLVRLGLAGQPEGGPIKQSLLRAEFLEYAKDFERRTTARLEVYKEYLDQQTVKGPTAYRTLTWRRIVVYGRKYFDWLEHKGLRPAGSNPFQGIRMFPVLTFTKGRIVTVQKWFYQLLKLPMSKRDAAMIFLMANGLRCQEVATLKYSNIHPENQSVRIIGKGGRVRVIYLYQRTWQRLVTWTEARRHFATAIVFPSTVVNQHGLSHKTIFRTVKRYARIAFPTAAPRDIAARKQMRPHMLRHFFASEWVRRGGSPVALKAMLGHSSVNMTNHYITVDEEWIRDELRKTEVKL